MPNRVFFINRFFYPDQSATSQMLSDVAEHLAATGWSVHIITSRMSFSDASVWLDKETTWQSVNITRVSTTRFGRASVVGRLFDYLSFYFSSFFKVLVLVRKGDIVVVKTDPPMLSVTLGLVARLKRAVRVNWLQDLFPEVAEKAGFGVAKGPTGAVLKWLRNRSLKSAKLNVAIGERMKDKLIDEGVLADSIRVIPNFCDDDVLVPNAANTLNLRTEWGFSDEDFVLEYSGNLGRAHDVDTILDVAEQIADQPHMKFLFIGGGHQKALLQEKAEKRGLTSFYFQPYQERSDLARSLGVGDMHWMSLQPEMEGLIVPSKFYGIAAVGKPVLMIGDPQGEIGEIVRKQKCGLVVRPGDSQTAAKELLSLAKNRARLSQMGEAAREYIDQYAKRELSMRRWNLELEALTARESLVADHV